MGLDPRTPGPRPGPKAGAKPLSHPGIPNLFLKKQKPDIKQERLHAYLKESPKSLTLFFIFLRFYLFIHERHIHTERERQRHRQREKQAPRREPNVGLDPGTPGPRPGPKAGTKLLSHPGIPRKFFERLRRDLTYKMVSVICCILDKVCL